MSFKDNSDRLEFGQIILGHIKKILNLSLMNIGSNGDRYCSAVITLGDCLIGYFDNEMEEAHSIFEKNRRTSKSLEPFRMYLRALLLLVKRHDYFKSAVYGEDSDELVNEEEGDSEE